MPAAARESCFALECVVLDSWYASPANLRASCGHDWRWVTHLPPASAGGRPRRPTSTKPSGSTWPTRATPAPLQRRQPRTFQHSRTRARPGSDFAPGPCSIRSPVPVAA